MDFRQELIEEVRLRTFLQRAIKARYIKHKSESLNEERDLRKIIRRLLESDTEKTQHRSTGINVLEDLLKKIVPVIEQDYKMLTTDPDQRKSFSAHIVSAIENTIAPVSATDDAGISLMELRILKEIEVELGTASDEDSEDLDSSAFIDIAGDSDEEGAMQDLGDEDKTGLNFAQSTFGKIEKQIVDAYSLLGNDEDKDLFYKYLITNIKLYFDKFEDELKTTIDEPTTPEYEDEKGKSDDSGSGEEESGEEELEL